MDKVWGLQKHKMESTIFIYFHFLKTTLYNFFFLFSVTKKKLVAMTTLNDRDQKLVWHPFTVGKVPDPVIGLTRAAGSYVYDENGKGYLDLVSSWWVNIHGHCHPEIADAVSKQSRTLDHVIFAGFTHEPAVELCELLHELLPAELGRFIFSDNGSTALETAIKMCYQYWLNKGRTDKSLFLTFDKGYHGATVGAMSLGIASGLCAIFDKLLFAVNTVPYPDTWQDEDERIITEKEDDCVKALEEELKINGHRIAGFFLEPLVQGVGGMRICRPEFVERVTELTKSYEIPVIFDEVFCGFGRTGTVFAFQQTKVLPDILCLSKGLTGGMVPLSLLVTTQDMYRAFLQDDYHKVLVHGHSYCGNPLSCAAAIASIKILTRPSTAKAIEVLAEAQRNGLRYLRERCSDQIHRIRYLGTIAAFDLKNADILKPFKLKCLDEGLIIRPLQGNTISIVPPYSTNKADVERAYSTIAEILKELK